MHVVPRMRALLIVFLELRIAKRHELLILLLLLVLRLLIFLLNLHVFDSIVEHCHLNLFILFLRILLWLELKADRHLLRRKVFGYPQEC